MQSKIASLPLDLDWCLHQRALASLDAQGVPYTQKWAAEMWEEMKTMQRTKRTGK